MHTGYCRPTASPPHAAIQELRATVRVLPPQDCMSLQHAFNFISKPLCFVKNTFQKKAI